MRVRSSKGLAPMLAVAAILLNFEPAFACSTREKSYQTAMRSDLRNLVTAQEAFHVAHGRYARSVEEASTEGFHRSTGVAGIAIDARDDTGWSATATHSQTSAVCRIYVGALPPGFDSAQQEGDLPCEGGNRGWVLDGQPVGFSVLLLMACLTLAAVVFFRGPRRVPRAGLATLTVLFALVVALNSLCGLYPVMLLAFFLVPALGLFALDFWRHVRSPAAPA